MLQEIKTVLAEFLQVDDLLDAKVRRKIASLSRRVPEGSAEWDVLYRQYFEEEKRKLAEPIVKLQLRGNREMLANDFGGSLRAPQWARDDPGGFGLR